MPLHLQQLNNSGKLNTTLEELNSTLLALRQTISSPHNTKYTPQQKHSLYKQQSSTPTLPPLPEKINDSFALSFHDTLQEASRSLKQFSQSSKNEISDLTSFILKRFASVNFGNLFSNPLSTIGSLFTAKAHKGGFITDLALPYQSDEVPIIAKKGEAIFTPQQLDNADALLKNALGGKSGGVTVHVHNNAGVSVDTKEITSQNGDISLDVVISEAENLMSRRIAMGSGLAPVIETRYGISPRARG